MCVIWLCVCVVFVFFCVFVCLFVCVCVVCLNFAFGICDMFGACYVCSVDVYFGCV